MILENIKFTGQVNFLLTDASGSEKLNKTYPNLVVFSGKNYIASRMASNNTVIMSHLSVGGSNTAPANNNTTLAGEFARVALTSTTVSSNTVTYLATFYPGTGTGAIVEAGIFNSATANNGDMLCRTTFPVVNKEGGDTLTITWNVTAN
jgi:hypothetical protein